MRRMLKTYLPFSRAGFQDAIAYKMNFLAFFLGEVFYCFVMYFVWKAVFQSTTSPTFMGFTMGDMVVFLFVSNVTRYLVGTDSTYAVGEEIKDGSIIMRLIKPVQYDRSILFFELGQKVTTIIMVTLPILIGVEVYKFLQTGITGFRLHSFIFFVISITLAYLLSFYMNICFGFMAFFLKNLWGFNILKEGIINFLSGAIIPIAFMPTLLQKILGALPFASLSYTPVMIYMGKYSGFELFSSIGLQIIWLIIIYGLSKGIWHLSIKHLTVQGG